MKRTPIRAWSVAPLLALCCVVPVQASEVRHTEAKAKSPLIPQGLLRLGGMPASPGGAAIPASAISIVDLQSPQVAGPLGRIASQGKVPYLALPPGIEWSTPLRPLRTGANYTTFTLQASIGSVVSVDGAHVSLVKSEQPGYATVMVGYRKTKEIEWMSLLHDVELRPYLGQLMGTLAIVTICTDTEYGRWSISLCDRLAAQDLPLDPVDARGPRVLSVKSGAAGAWVCGLASSDENPVFEDANHNGVRDNFEMKVLSAPIKRDASRETRDALVRAWKERKYIEPSDYALATQEGTIDWDSMPAHFDSNIPASDAIPEPDGRQVHGIATSAIYK
jgi:hypothetical protein